MLTLFLVSPVTFKIRRQKYQVLLFFLRLDEHIIKQSCLKSNIFEDKFSNEKFVKSSYDDIAAIAAAADDNDELQDDDYVKHGSVVHYMESGLKQKIEGQERKKTELTNLLDERLNQIKQKKEEEKNPIAPKLT